MRFETVLGLAVLASGLGGCGDYGGDLAGPDAEDSIGTLLGRSPNGDVRSTFKVVRGTGDITPTVAQFRALLGEPSNGAAMGQQPSGRREISWDGVPPAFTNVNTFPALFFNNRGANFGGPGNGFRNSDNDFADLNPSYAAQFESFSKPKTFMPVGSSEMEVLFTVAGFDTPAAVTGFGIVFSDVDRQGAASIKLFDAAGRSLGRYHPPVRSDANGLSFLGVVFDAAVVRKVVITSGQAAIDAGLQDLSDGGNRDLVVTDDFIYGEPQALP
ncbi:MAG TPA: hypothetical protein VFM14_16915 [Gemmatimonadales bacterium]|nr:hypothetical protein [Gemmatimonadales bacterium]